MCYEKITLLLADDHDMLMDGLIHMLRRDFDVVGVAHDGRKMIEMAKEKRPDVIATDISMPNLNGIDAARMLRQDIPSIKILFLTMHSDYPLVGEAFRGGASGFVLKTCDMSELVEAIHSIAKGSTYITPPARNTASSIRGFSHEPFLLPVVGSRSAVMSSAGCSRSGQELGPGIPRAE